MDINLNLEGNAGKVSRLHAFIKLRSDGHFYIRNVGKRVIRVNNKVSSCFDLSFASKATVVGLHVSAKHEGVSNVMFRMWSLGRRSTSLASV